MLDIIVISLPPSLLMMINIDLSIIMSIVYLGGDSASN